MDDFPLDAEDSQAAHETPRSLREEYARQVNERYRRRLKGFVRATLSSRVRKTRDATSDVVQDVLKSFLESDESHCDVNAIWPILCRFAERKVKNSAKKHRRQGRDVRREVSDNSLGCESTSPIAEFVDESSDLAPLEALIIVEELERLTPEEIEIVTLRRDGVSFQAIAEHLGISDESGVRRRLDRLLNRWRTETAD